MPVARPTLLAYSFSIWYSSRVPEPSVTWCLARIPLIAVSHWSAAAR